MVKLFITFSTHIMDNSEPYFTRCIPARIAIALILVFFQDVNFVRFFMASVSIVFSVGFAFKIGRNVYLHNGASYSARFCTANSKEKGFFSGTVWWHHLRYVHVLTWGFVAALLIEGSASEWAGAIALADILPGLLTKWIKAQRQGDTILQEPSRPQDGQSIFRF